MKEARLAGLFLVVGQALKFAKPAPIRENPQRRFVALADASEALSL
jgi:hypothetical protein